MKVVKKGYDGPKVTNTESFIVKAMWQHGDKYDYSESVYNGSGAKIKIICKEHGPFYQRASDHTNKAAGCQTCKNQSTGNRCRTRQEDFISRAIEIHGSKYDYSLVEYKGSKRPVEIVCPIHGIFEKLPYLHIQKSSGCYHCHLESRRKPKEIKVNFFDKFTSEYFAERSREIHGGYYSYDKVNYKNNATKVVITCPVHGGFLQKPNTHLNGSGCKECRKDKLRKRYQKSNYDFEKDSRKIHGGKYDYSKVDYISNKHKVEIICPTHGSFWQKPNNHLYAEFGCPVCADKESGGWGKSNGYYNTDKESHIYLVEMSGHGEKFLKIGLAKDYISRHRQIENESGYSVNVIFTYSGKANLLYETEFHLLKETEFSKYRPSVVFGGVSECYEFSQKYEILDYIRRCVRCMKN